MSFVPTIPSWSHLTIISLVPRPHPENGEGLAHFEQFLGCADSAGMKNHSLNQIAVFQNIIKNHMIVMKSDYRLL